MLMSIIKIKYCPKKIQCSSDRTAIYHPTSSCRGWSATTDR